MNTENKAIQKNLIRALVIRLRLYLALEHVYCRTEEDRFIFAGDVLNISSNRARHILSSNEQIKALSKKECIAQLQNLSYTMYIVAISDITYNKYVNLLRKEPK